MRSEQEIFNELESLALEPNFWELIAFFCWKDTFIHIKGEKLEAGVFTQSFSHEKLSRTELSTLIGIACKNNTEINGTDIKHDDLIEKAQNVWNLLDELHHSFIPQIDVGELASGTTSDSSRRSSFMREAIFYGGEGAFKHQYRDFSKLRYINDDKWLEENKGFNTQQVVDVISAIDEVQVINANNYMQSDKREGNSDYLSIFTFSLDEIVQKVKDSEEVVKKIINAFSAFSNEGMDCFNSVDDFNHRNAFPIIKRSESTYVSFQSYSLWESLYESPFFWFNDDKSYRSNASKNRGAFTEDFTAERLACVFGHENVFTNIDIFDGKDKACEIDVLVTFGEFAIVVQAKSKKLTISARKGNSQQLDSDFKNAVQNAYNQALQCSQLLQQDGLIFKKETGEEVLISSKLTAIFPICIVSDHYPALAAQARHFLTYEVTDIIKHPYVMDVFLLDMITEMLDTPILILDYLMKRSNFGETILSNHELVILATYIKQNLYFDENPDLVMLDEDISGELELAMLARRDELEEELKTPEGILTVYDGTHIGSILTDLAHSKEYSLQALGFFILSISGDTIERINNHLDEMIKKFQIDKCNHDMTLYFSEGKTGLTIHCNDNETKVAYESLLTHCDKRKYSCKADVWHGIHFSPTELTFTFTIYNKYEWKQSDEMDEITSKLNVIDSKSNATPVSVKKIGRNEKCPCGSGKKYKKCCLP
ncbi:prepilin peptidase [Aliivibrio fischeri]|uniref:nuclease-related domain-containing protein n=1 Tax=Aliivibrio fischeri TaxID=668 RepID=UPI00080E60F8|nr:nuclease-related domain-containing protein [Aliivibrio fischeri]OCH59765.1 prepilin peptidase [Aliivibrio fischeri]